jgi:armadillo repeat-containing protein 8
MPQHIESLNTILSMSPSTPTIQSQIDLVAGLISRLCREDRHQAALANSGVLDALATRLASFGVADGLVIPVPELLRPGDGLSDVPDPAPRNANLAVILESISMVIAGSRFRACMLLCSPAILAVFPLAGFLPTKRATAPWYALESTGLGDWRNQKLGAMDYLLPAVPTHQTRGQVPHASASASAPGGSLEPRESGQSGPKSATARQGSGGLAWESTRFEPFGQSSDSETEERESPLIPWLEYLVRSRNDHERLMASSVLTSLFKSGFGSKTLRETSLGLLVVPVLLDMLTKHDTPSVIEPTDYETKMAWTILEKTPTVLARLIMDSEFLQKAAFDCDAVKTFTKLLKDAYEPIPSSSQPRTWSPHTENGTGTENAPPACRLGPEGQPPLLAHRVRLRESALKAIGALAAGKDEYRKAFVEQDVVPYVVESLNEAPSMPRTSKERVKPDVPNTESVIGSQPSSAFGQNPLSVVIAACHAVRMLSRSVSILRTSLVDYGVAMPMFRFLRHPDIQVQIAATAAICNLVLEVSPMREVSAPSTEEGDSDPWLTLIPSL